MRLFFLSLALMTLIATLISGCSVRKIHTFDDKQPPKIIKSSKFEGVGFQIELLPNPAWIRGNSHNRNDLITVLSYYGAYMLDYNMPEKVGDFRISMKILTPTDSFFPISSRVVEVKVFRKEIDGWFPYGQPKTYKSTEGKGGVFSYTCPDLYGCITTLGDENGAEFLSFIPTFSTALVTTLNDINIDTMK